MDFARIHSVYMLGIGGIGMSALARWFALHGKRVSGYDKTKTTLTEALHSEGIPVEYDFNPSSIEGADLLVITPAVPIDNPVMQRAVELGIRIVKRAALLGELSQGFRTIGIAGTHGKTTTTGLTTWLMREGGIDCTGFIGGIVKNFNSNFVPGKSKWIVCEADEYDRSFLQLSPEVIGITSTDPDHLDIYGSAQHVKEGYELFAGKCKAPGLLILNQKIDSFSQAISENALFYGLEKGDVRAENIKVGDMGSSFDYVTDKERVKDLFLGIPGGYNLENAVLAITAARYAGASWEGIKTGLTTFMGVGRRFDLQYLSGRIAFVDDYAHHPEEIRSLMGAVKQQFPGWRTVAVFQPHLFSRTRDFMEDFAQALSIADEVVLLEIYPARELPIEGITSKALLEKLSIKTKRIAEKEALPEILREQVKDKTVFLTIGAGDIDACVEPIREMLEKIKA